MAERGSIVPLRASGQQSRQQQIMRRRLAAGWLAVMAFSPTMTVIALSDDVAEVDLAAVLRHLDEGHPPTTIVQACRAPYCNAVSCWRAPPPVAVIASSA